MNLNEMSATERKTWFIERAALINDLCQESTSEGGDPIVGKCNEAMTSPLEFGGVDVVLQA
jgi:hypothetical protein